MNHQSFIHFEIFLTMLFPYMNFKIYLEVYNNELYTVIFYKCLLN